MKKRIPGIAVWLVATSTFSLLATILFWWSPVHAVEAGAMAAGAAGPDAMNWGFVAAALATGLSSDMIHALLELASNSACHFVWLIASAPRMIIRN